MRYRFVEVCRNGLYRCFSKYQISLPLPLMLVQCLVHRYKKIWRVWVSALSAFGKSRLARRNRVSEPLPWLGDNIELLKLWQ